MMFQKKISAIILALFLMFLIGCTESKDESASQAAQANTEASARGEKSASEKLIDEGYRLLASRNPDSQIEACELFQQAADLAGKENDITNVVQALAMLARGYLERGLPAEGEPHLAAAKSKASEDNPKAWSMYLQVQAMYERDFGDPATATAIFTDLYQYCHDHKLYRRAVDAAHHVALAADLETQIEWGLKGIAEAEAGGFTGWLGSLWNNLGNSYDELGRYQESLDAYIKAEEYHKANGSDNPLINHWAQGKAHRQLGNLIQAREMLEEATRLAKKAFAETADNNTWEWLGWCAWEIGELLLLEEKKDEALLLLKEGLVILEEVGIKSWGNYFLELYNEMAARLAELEG